MSQHESFSDFVCEEQMRLAERELSAFLGAVTELYGPAQARLSEKDWLDESGLMDESSMPDRNWRAVTIAASARLAERLSAVLEQPKSAGPNDTKVSPIPSSNGFCSGVLA